MNLLVIKNGKSIHFQIFRYNNFFAKGQDCKIANLLIFSYAYLPFYLLLLLFAFLSFRIFLKQINNNNLLSRLP